MLCPVTNGDFVDHYVHLLSQRYATSGTLVTVEISSALLFVFEEVRAAVDS